MRGLDHRKPGKRRFGLGDTPTDLESQKWYISSQFPRILIEPPL